MSDSILGSIFGFGNRLRDSIRNPNETLHTIASALEENRSDSKAVFGDGFAGKRKLSEKELLDRDIEQGMGFINPIPLGTMGNFLLRKKIEDVATNMSRRDFMKKSAGIAGGTAAASIPGAKLLQKFAPEERAAVKQAAVEAAPKYKYNSLKEYLDDVETSVYSKYEEPWFDEVNDLTARQQIQQRLLQDEQAHNTAKFFYKDNLKEPTTGKWIDPYTGQPHSEEFLKNIRNTTNDFSPQAKKEMKEYKDYIRNGYYDYNKHNNPTMTEEELSAFIKDTWTDHIIDDFSK